MDTMKNTDDTARIVRVLAVRDTRQCEEIGDRWVPIPGSGVARQCDRCGRDHEVHVDVELDNGRTAVIGAGCARGESMDVQSKIKSAVSAAKTLAKLQSELASERAKLARHEAAAAEVAMLTMPIAEKVEEFTGAAGHREIWSMGDATVWTFGAFDTERRAALENGWRHNRMMERGETGYASSYHSRITELKARISKAERRISATEVV